jgi:hypothetical protein
MRRSLGYLFQEFCIGRSITCGHRDLESMCIRQANSIKAPLKIITLKIVKPRFGTEKSRSHFKGSLALGVDDRLAFPLTDHRMTKDSGAASSRVAAIQVTS